MVVLAGDGALAVQVRADGRLLSAALSPSDAFDLSCDLAEASGHMVASDLDRFGARRSRRAGALGPSKG